MASCGTGLSRRDGARRLCTVRARLLGAAATDGRGAPPHRDLLRNAVRALATYLAVSQSWLGAGAADAEPLHMWRGLIGTLDVPELWELLMFAYMLEEERTGYLSFHLTSEDSFEGGSATSMFVNATRCFRDTFRTLQTLIKKYVGDISRTDSAMRSLPIQLTPCLPSALL